MRGNRLRLFLTLTLAMVMTGPGGVWANPGHEITIAELSAQIALTPGLPELYFQRAWNYRENRQLGEARADWAKTLELNPGFLPASRELARLDAAEGRVDAALDGLRQAMAAAPPEQAFHRPGCFSVLAELLLSQNKNAEALAEAKAGLAAADTLQLDLVLLRSEAQRRLGRWEERVKDLHSTTTQLRSFVVKTKWIEAMIDAGRGAEVLPLIEEEISNTRYQASWLIRRARIRLRSGDAAGARADLHNALAEINNRLRPDLPDLSLLCDRGVIRALLGERTSAAEDLLLARQQGADFWMTQPLAALLEESPSGPQTLPEAGGPPGNTPPKPNPPAPGSP
jgi:tetratricopeptide (TPR) repeat protein